MASVKAKFSVIYTRRDNDPTFSDYLWVKGASMHTANRELFEKLGKLEGEFKDRGESGRYLANIAYPSVEFETLRDTLSTFGIALTEPNSSFTREEGNLFPDYHRVFDPEETAEFPLFTFGHVSTVIGNYASRDKDEKLTIQEATEIGNVDYGILHPYGAIAFSTDLKNQIENITLKTGYFRPVLNSHGGPSSLWQLWSDVEMPFCETPMVGEDYQPLSPDDESVFFYDEGYFPPILSFNKSAVVKLGDFDLAVMQERWGPFGSHSDRAVVISKELKSNLEQLNVPEMSFRPVHLSNSISLT